MTNSIHSTTCSLLIFGEIRETDELLDGIDTNNQFFVKTIKLQL